MKTWAFIVNTFFNGFNDQHLRYCHVFSNHDSNGL